MSEQQSFVECSMVGQKSGSSIARVLVLFVQVLAVHKEDNNCAVPGAAAADCRIQYSAAPHLCITEAGQNRTKHLLGQLIKRLAVQLASLLGCQQQELQSWTAELALSKSLIEVQRLCLQPPG